LRKEISLVLILVLFATALTLVIKVHAATLDVGPIGYPYTDIQLAVNAANPGDTILVHPGVYTERGPFPIGWGPGDRWAPPVIVYKDGLTIRSTNGPAVTKIECNLTFWMNPMPISYSTGGAVNQVAAPSAVIIIANDVTIDGFTIVSNYVGDHYQTWHPNTGGVFIGGLGAGYLDYEGVGRATIVNNDISGWAGIYIWKSPGNTIKDNMITTRNTNATDPTWSNVPPGSGIGIWDCWNQGNPAISTKGTVITGNTIVGTPITNQGYSNKGIDIGGYFDGYPPADRSATIGPCNKIKNWCLGISIWNSGGTFTIQYMIVEGNTMYGLVDSASTVADARYVYWGDLSGPYHPTLNPTGLGNQVSDNVNFVPWKHIESCNPEYYLTVKTDPSGAATIAGEGWYDAGSTATLTAPTFGTGSYRFYSWDVDGAMQGTTNPINVLMNTDHTATAHYSDSAVGGEWAPINTVQLVSPWVALALIAIAFAAAGSHRLLKKRL
jgi:hypothetical protein